MSPTTSIAPSPSDGVATITSMSDPRIGETCEVSLAPLKRALTRVKGAMGRKTAVQALTGARIYSREGAAYVETTDMKTAVRLVLNVQSIGKDFDTLLGVRELQAALKGADKAALVTLTIEEHDNGRGTATCRVAVKVGPASYSLRELRRVDFPALDFAPGEPIVSLPGEELEHAVQRAAVFASKDQTRPVLTAVHITAAEGGKIVATDGCKLDVAPLANVTAGTELAIPAAPLALALKGAAKIEADVSVTHRDSLAVIERPSEVWTTRVIVGQFPNYSQLLPEANGKGTTVVGLPIAAMLVAAQGADAVLERNAPVRLMLHQNGPASERCELTGYTPDATEYAASVEDVMLSAWEHDEPTLEVGLNPTFFSELLSVQSGEVVGVTLFSPLRPLTFRDSTGAISLLMPIRLNG